MPFFAFEREEQSIYSLPAKLRHSQESSLVGAAVEFMYGGGVALTSSNILGMLDLSCELDLAPLRRQCCVTLASSLDSDNCWLVLSAADRLNLSALKTRTAAYCRDNFVSATSTTGGLAGWCDLSQAIYSFIHSFVHSFVFFPFLWAWSILSLICVCACERVCVLCVVCVCMCMCMRVYAWSS